jgi:hypothetical protein
MSYRSDARTVAKETRWTVFRFLPIFIVVMVILGGTAATTRYLGMWGKTTVERKVFEASYQRSEALVSEIATNEATVKEIEGQLQNPNLDENTRYNLNAQLSAARIRLNTARSKQ